MVTIEFWTGLALGAIGWHYLGEALIAWIAARLHDNRPHRRT